MRLFSLMLGLLLLSSQVCATAKPTRQRYQSSQYNYTIEFDNNWRIYQSGSNQHVLILVCNSRRCDPGSQFIISTNRDSALRNMNNTTFMQSLQPKTVRQLLGNMVQSIGKLDELSYLKRTKFGKYLGYQAKVKIKLFNGTERILYYGLTFERGVFYNFQFFASQTAFSQDLPLIEKLYDSFSIESSS